MQPPVLASVHVPPVPVTANVPVVPLRMIPREPPFAETEVRLIVPPELTRVTAAALVVAGYASAAPLNPKQVAKEAKWVAHVDVDAMRESIVVKKAYEKAVAIDPGNAYILNNLGLVMRRLGRIDEATRAYAAAIQFNPGYAVTYKNYGILLEQNGETRRAIDAYRRYASLAPSAPDAAKVSQRADWLEGGF